MLEYTYGFILTSSMKTNKIDTIKEFIMNTTMNAINWPKEYLGLTDNYVSNEVGL